MSNYEVKNVEPVAVSNDVQVRVFTLAHGDVIPWHYHRESTDHYFVLRGTLTIETRGPDNRCVLPVGERYKILPGTAHRISNESTSECQFLLVQGVGKYDWHRGRLSRMGAPAAYQWPEMADEGGFVAYGPRLIQTEVTAFGEHVAAADRRIAATIALEMIGPMPGTVISCCVLFGLYFWSVIQDRCDRQVRTVGIMARPGDGQGGPSELIWIPLPSDFGTSDYSRRRAKVLTKHLSAIAETKAELLRLFDSWLAPSARLREYVGAHRRESIETARKLVELIPPAVLKNVLGYLVLHYWAHRSGWPDLLVYRPHQWFLAEIKSWRDKLNENQKRWIEDNHRYLHLPFKLVHVHRMECNVSALDVSIVGRPAASRLVSAA